MQNLSALHENVPMNLRLRASVLMSAIAAMLVVSGCQAPGLAPSSGDLLPEVGISRANIETLWSHSNNFSTSEVLPAPDGATRVGFMLDVTSAHATDALVLQARGFSADGAAGPWNDAVIHFSEDLLRVGYVDLQLSARAVQVQLSAQTLEATDTLVYNAVVPPPREEGPAFASPFVDSGAVDLVSGPAVATQALDIAGVQPRSAWNAAPTRCTSLNTTKTKVSVHHTVTPTSSNGSYSARIRGIQAYHQDSNGWCDIGYHFMVTLDGRTWEAREAKYLGSHVGSQNTNNVGVSFVGCFQTNGCNDWGPFVPPQVMVNAGGELIGKLATRYGITVSPSTVMGHRDNPGQSTSCPGDNLHARLGDMRAIASGAGPSEPPSGRVQGVVWDLSLTSDAGASLALGARLPGATITSNTGVSSTARAEDAFWALDLAPGTYTLTARAEGFADATREVQVTAGAEGWASMGVAPTAQAAALRVVVQDVVTATPIALATVQATGTDPGQTDASGAISFTLVPGGTTVTASAEGYETLSDTFILNPGAQERVLALVPERVPEPPTPESEPPTAEPSAPTPEGTPEGEPEQVVTFEPDVQSPEPGPEDNIRAPLVSERPSVVGCSAATVPSAGIPFASLLLLGMAALWLRRRPDEMGSGAR